MHRQDGSSPLDRPATLLAALGDQMLELRVDKPIRSPRSPRLPQQGVVLRRDSFAVGATLTIPLRDRSVDRRSTDAREIVLAANRD